MKVYDSLPWVYDSLPWGKLSATGVSNSLAVSEKHEKARKNISITKKKPFKKLDFRGYVYFTTINYF